MNTRATAVRLWRCKSRHRQTVLALALFGAIPVAVISPAAAPQFAITATTTVATAATPSKVAPVQLISAAAFASVLQQHQGQVVVLNLWATWCVSCLKEIPDLMVLAREYAPRGFSLLAVSMDDPLERETVEAFRRQRFPEFASWLRQEAEMDAFVSPLDPAWNELLPTTYLIGRDGKVLKRLQGKKSLEEFRAELNAVL